jgi:hypothetical protein
MLTIKNIGKLILAHSKGFVLVIAMIICAAFFNDKEIILPELAALSIGSLVYKDPEWVRHPFYLFLIPSITALLGYGINVLPVSIVLKLTFVLISVFMVMLSFGKFLAPALATGLLPVITNSTSWLFIASILVFMFALALFIRLTVKPGEVNLSHEGHIRLNFWAYLFFLICWLVICNAIGHVEIAAIPPVIVVGFEMMHKKTYSADVLIKQVLILTLAAFVGAYSLYFLHNLLWTVLVDMMIVFSILHILKAKMPPAYAISLLPMVLHMKGPGVFVVCVFVMASFMFTFVYFWKKHVEHRMMRYMRP